MSACRPQDTWIGVDSETGERVGQGLRVSRETSSKAGSLVCVEMNDLEDVEFGGSVYLRPSLAVYAGRAMLLAATTERPAPDGYDIIVLAFPRVAAGVDMVAALYGSSVSFVRPSRLIHRLCRIAGIEESPKALRDWADSREPHERARLLALAMFDLGRADPNGGT